MSLEFKFRRTHFSREHEFLDRISNLLSALSVDSKLPKFPKQITPIINSNKNSGRAKSLHPKFTLFQFSLPINIKNPIISVPELPVVPIPPIKKTRISKTYKPKVPTFIRPKKCHSPHNQIEDNMGRYKKILNLTQDLIDKDSLEGWN